MWRGAEIDCATGSSACLEASNTNGFIIDEAEVTYRGTCPVLAGVTGQVLEKAFQYWQDIDGDTGKQIEANVRAARNCT
jgi:hypothetical protein